MNVVMFTQVDDQKPWAENSRFKSKKRDLSRQHPAPVGRGRRRRISAISPMFLDVQFDRGRDNAMAETPMLKIVEERDDGILVRGWKAIGTSVPFVNSPSDRQPGVPARRAEQTVYALVPIATEGHLGGGAQVERRAGRRFR